MKKPTEHRLIVGAFLLSVLVLTGCEGESRPFEEAVEIQTLGLKSIDVLPPAEQALVVGDIVLNRGQSLQLSLTGQSDEQTDIALGTSKRNWSSSNPAAVSVNENGVITGGDDGDATIKATLGAYEATLKVVVADAVLISLESVRAFDGNTVIERCLPEDYIAVGNFTGGTQRPVYDASYTVSAGASVERVNDRARVNAFTAGAVTVTASAPDATAEAGRTMSTQPTVGTALSAIEITPGLVSMSENDSEDLKATGTYSAVTGTDITDNVDWKIAPDSSSATLGNDNDNKGELKGKAEGTARVTASCGDIVSDEVVVTISEVSAARSPTLTFSVGESVSVKVNDELDTLEIRRGSVFSEGEPVSRTKVTFAILSGAAFIDEQELREDGVIKGVSVGTAKIRVTLPVDPDVSGSTEATGEFEINVEAEDP